MDATRDLRGMFFAKEAWREKHRELAEALRDEFGCAFHDNGNSFDTCFQFEGRLEGDLLALRIKYYCKYLAYI